MAKKKKSKSDFNTSEQIRNILKGNKKLTGREVYDALVKKFPKKKFNHNSVNVAVYNAKKKKGKKK